MTGRIVRWSDRLVRAIHDSHMAVVRAAGPTLGTVELGQNCELILLQRPGHSTIWDNPVERHVYGDQVAPRAVNHPSLTIQVLHGAWVTGSEAHVFADRTRRVVTDRSLFGIDERKIRRPIRWLARRERGVVFHLGGRGSGNRAHFLLEHLPRLLLARTVVPASQRLRILLAPSHEAWQCDYLNRLSDPNWEPVRGSYGTTWCESLMYVPNLSAGVAAEIAEPWIYQLIRLALLPTCTGDRKAIFLSRKDAAARRLANEDAVFAACRDAVPSLERHQLAGLTLQQQINLLGSARVVIGPHGQGFHLGLVCSDALQVQLVPGERSMVNEYAQWATNFERLGMLGGSRCVSLYADNGGGSSDWTFPLNRLSPVLDLLSDADKCSR